MTFKRLNSSLSRSSNTPVIKAMVAVYWGMMIFCRAFARFWAFLMALASRYTLVSTSANVAHSRLTR